MQNATECTLKQCAFCKTTYCLTKKLEKGSQVEVNDINYFTIAGHPWIRVDGEAPDKPLDSAVLSRLKQFSAMNKLKKMAIRVCYFLLFWE